MDIKHISAFNDCYMMQQKDADIKSGNLTLFAMHRQNFKQ